MRYYEIATFAEAVDSEKQAIKAQKQRAQVQLKNAKRQKELAKQADLRLKQKRSQETLSKINRTPIS